MLLTENNMVHYLLDRGLFDKTSFTNGKFSCTAADSRHKIYVVNKEYENNRYFIKQALGSTAEKIRSLEREALFYEMVAEDENFRPLQKYLAASLHYDNRNAILILEYFADHKSLYDQLLHQQEFDRALVATELADALFRLATLPAGTFEKSSGIGFITAFKPWILNLPQVKSTAANTERSSAEATGLQLISDVPGFINLVEAAAKLWEPSCMVHGDSKLNNFMINAGKNKTGNRCLKLMDWELFNAGDPLWDLATVFQSALTAWVIHEDPVYKTNPGVNHFDTQIMQAFIRACFTNYAAANQWDKPETGKKLEKCTAFCGLRLVHNCFETTPHAHSLRPYSARLLQLAFNVLSNPAGAAQQVLGIKS